MIIGLVRQSLLFRENPQPAGMMTFSGKQNGFGEQRWSDALYRQWLALVGRIPRQLDNAHLNSRGSPTRKLRVGHRITGGATRKAAPRCGTAFRAFDLKR